jgi:geranylgeranyl diphosphate synthase, type I
MSLAATAGTADARTRSPTWPSDAVRPRLQAAVESFLAHRPHADLAPELAAELGALVVHGGKRLRPAFAWWAWRAAGGPDTGPAADATMRALVALELLQACALVHDDVMDRATTRRGRPTSRHTFATRHRRFGWSGDHLHYGDSAAILIGDLALAWADDALVTAGLPAETLARAWVPWQAMRIQMLAGQHLDLLAVACREESLTAALRVAGLKTASYTAERPLHLGAALGGAPDELVTALRSFGRDVGIAFQLRDDLLGVFGDPERTGKPVGDDLRQGKRTPLMMVAIARAEAAGRDQELALLRDCLGGPVTEAMVCRAGVALRELGAVQEIEQRITTLTRRALGTLRRAGPASGATDALAALADEATIRHD